MKLASFFPIWLVLFFATQDNNIENESSMPSCGLSVNQVSCKIHASATYGADYYVFEFTSGCNSFKTDNLTNNYYLYTPPYSGYYSVEVAACYYSGGCCYENTTINLIPGIGYSCPTECDL